MAKKIIGSVKLQIAAGAATSAPPVGPALGPYGVDIGGFCKQFNSKTQGQPGMIIPVVLTIYADRTFTFITKTPPAAVLLKKAAGLAKGSAVPNRDKVGTVIAGAGPRDREAQGLGPERGRRGSRDEDGGRDGEEHGHRDRRLGAEGPGRRRARGVNAARRRDRAGTREDRGGPPRRVKSERWTRSKTLQRSSSRS